MLKLDGILTMVLSIGIDDAQLGPRSYGEDNNRHLRGCLLRGVLCVVVIGRLYMYMI